MIRLRKQLNCIINPEKNHVLRLAFVGSVVEQPLLSEVVKRFDVDFSILFGQIEDIQEQAFGSLVILAQGDVDKLAQAVDYIKSRDVVVEELDHVVANG